MLCSLNNTLFKLKLLEPTLTLLQELQWLQSGLQRWQFKKALFPIMPWQCVPERALIFIEASKLSEPLVQNTWPLFFQFSRGQALLDTS
jgi:hypothetical protein